MSFSHRDGQGPGGDGSSPDPRLLPAAAARNSRHGLYPRADHERLRRLHSAAAALEAQWRAEARSADGPVGAMATLSPAAPLENVVAVLNRFAAASWLGARIDAALALLAADCFALPPMGQAGGGDGVWALLLAEEGAWRLSLQLHRFELGYAPPTATLFVPGRAAIRVLADGGALLRRHRVAVSADEEAGGFTATDAARCESLSPRSLRRGEVLALDTARDSITLERATGDVLLLELAAQPPSPLPARTYDMGSGRLIHVAASRRDNSFRLMALTLLRAMGRADAAPLFVAATDDMDFHMRWAAARELVALDSAAAQGLLARLAVDDPHPEVRRAAAATLALYPAEEQLGCPA